MAKVVNNPAGQTPAESSAQEFTSTFADDPCQVEVADGKIRARFRLTSFQSADAQFPAMTVEVRYAIVASGDDLLLVRDGNLKVQSDAKDNPDGPSGREQTLRLAVQRKLSKVFPDTTELGFSNVLGADAGESRLHVDKVQAEGGWLQIALRRPEGRVQQTASATAR